MEVLKSYDLSARWACLYSASGPWRARRDSRFERQPASKPETAMRTMHRAARAPRALPNRVILGQAFRFVTIRVGSISSTVTFALGGPLEEDWPAFETPENGGEV